MKSFVESLFNLPHFLHNKINLFSNSKEWGALILMNHNGILLGRRRFQYTTSPVAEVEGWTFEMAPGLKLIAGGSANPLQTLISLYREGEKAAQLVLFHRRCDSDVTVQAISSDLTLKIVPATRRVRVEVKQ